ncbi:hypothetical protein R3P38DRAFT_2550175 [Favolaschia claudopus]|uniref:Uncharacterized protein n=1 Tax=Favolaschia claudopus TaxID=2862362 RepID=A0AAV9Z6N1_9AGAR
MDIDAFLDALTAAGDIKLFTALVDVSALGKDSVRDAADTIADLIWDKIDYRFLYHSVYEFKRSSTARYEYTCAQNSLRQEKSQKKASSEKQRDKAQMSTFECQGWLTIWASPDDDSEYFIRIRHQECHQKYVCIDIPDDVKQIIRIIPSCLWKEILKSYPEPAFSQKAVYNLWAKQNQSEWRRTENELESAKILLAEFTKDSRYQLDTIPLADHFAGPTTGQLGLNQEIRALQGILRTLWAIRVRFDIYLALFTATLEALRQPLAANFLTTR